MFWKRNEEVKPFRLGQVVQVRSGGPPMTIMGCWNSPHYRHHWSAECVWFDRFNRVRSHMFEAETLEAVTQEAAK